MVNIDFCAKRVLDDKWIFGDLINSTDNSTFIHEIGGEVYRVWHDTICMFTGKYDVAGRGMYENRIVEESGGHRSVVKYSTEEAKFILEGKTIITDFAGKQLRVIGNIFDTPELLDDTK